MDPTHIRVSLISNFPPFQLRNLHEQASPLSRIVDLVNHGLVNLLLALFTLGTAIFSHLSDSLHLRRVYFAATWAPLPILFHFNIIKEKLMFQLPYCKIWNITNMM